MGFWGRLSTILFLVLGSSSGLLVSPSAAAGPFRIINRATDLDLSDPGELAIYEAFNSAANAVEDEINTNMLSTSVRQTFADNMARGSSSTLSALVFDRLYEPRELSVSVGGQFNAYAENDTYKMSAENTIPAIGVGGQMTLNFGFRASAIPLPSLLGLEPRRLFLHFNVMRFALDISRVRYTVFNIGLGVRYVAVPSRGSWWLKWGGITWGSGLQYSNTDVYVRMTLNDTQVTPIGGETATTTSELSTEIGANSTNFYMPFEVSTSVTFFDSLSFFVASAVDLNLGSSEVIGSASGPIQSTYSGNVAGVNNYFSGDASLDMTGGPTGRPNFLVARFTGGAAVKLFPLSLGAEVSWLSNGAYSAATNLRLIF